MTTDYLKNSKILIVDDTRANIDVLDSLLIMEGYENLMATADPRDVLDIYLKFKPDLILLDLNMPFMSGFEVMAQLRQVLNDQVYLPILVLTADASDATKKKALAAGASDFLSKPFDLVEVSLRIKNLLFTNYLYTQVRNQKDILEEKVKERTKELECKNKELKTAWEKAEAANRLKHAFLNNISHEIRTPLNGIIGFGHLLSDDNIGFDEKMEYLSFMKESSNRLINTVTSFLDVSILNSGNVELIMTKVQPENVLLETYDKFLSTCMKKKINLELSIEKLTDDFAFVSDENILRKILDNLVDNAIKFTAKGKIEIGGEIVNDGIRIFVKDTGIGISSEFSNRIFRSFNQEHEEITRPYEGLGLGLSISKGWVELLGGTIGYTTEPGKGTEFSFTLPAKIDTTAQKTKDHSVCCEGKKNKILIVEDDETNYFLLYFYLTNYNVELIHAHSGFEAISLFKANTDLDIVLMDLKLPDIDGFQTTQQIKLLNNTIPVIAVSSYSGIVERQQALHAGCEDFIVKPVIKPVLFDKLSKYITVKPK
jgi:signal transduction histidine kinase